MQLSIPSFILGSPTIYKIIASTDNGPIELDKRFSDFLKLAVDFEAEMDEPVPVPPPGKKWFGGNDVDFCERRRQDLELMMRALVRNPEYLAALCVQSFLQLSRKHTTNTDWLHLSSRVSSLISDAKAQTQATQKRKLCLEAKTHVAHLQKQLSSAKGVGAGEQHRRMNLIEEYSKSIQQMESQVLQSISSGDNDDKQPPRQLFVAAPSSRVLGETETTRKFNNTQLFNHQEDAMKEQDRQIESLRLAIARQKELGLTIDDELTKQNEMLEQLDSHVHQVNSKVNQAKRKTANIN